MEADDSFFPVFVDFWHFTVGRRGVNITLTHPPSPFFFSAQFKLGQNTQRFLFYLWSTVDTIQILTSMEKSRVWHHDMIWLMWLNNMAGSYYV